MTKINDPYFMDANESVLFPRELEHIKSRVWQVPRKPNKALDIFPISQDASPADKTITWREWDQVGAAVFMQDYFTEVPMADVFAVERSINVHSLANGYQVSIQELRESVQEGKQIDIRRATAVRDSFELKMNKLTWLGDADKGIQGFIDYPSTNEYIVPNGAGGDTEFSTKTPDEILTDLFQMETVVIEATNEVESPTVLLMPIAQERLISTKRLTDGDRSTIKKFFIDNSKTIKTIITVPELKDAGAGGSDRMISFEPSLEKISLEIPVLFEQFTQVNRGYFYWVPAHARYGGLIVYRPLSICIADGI